MKSKAKTRIAIMTLLAMLFVGPVFLNVVFAGEYVNGTQDDTLGVWLFSAGTTVPGDAPTDDIVERALFYSLLDLIGDEAVEVYDFDWGWIEPTTGQEDSTLAEVIVGLSAIDDFGDVSNPGDDNANFDTGSGGYFEGGFDPDDAYVIVADGVVATGVLGPSEVTSAERAEDALDGFEIFIFEDAELSGMTVTLSNDLGLSITISLADLQVNPPTQNYADDTLIAIDLDSLTGLDGAYVDTIRIQDDGISQLSTVSGDTTLEIDAICTRFSCMHAARENYARLAERRAKFYSDYADPLGYYGQPSSESYDGTMLIQTIEGLVPFLYDLALLSADEMAQDVAAQATHTGKAIESFKNWLEGLQGQLTPTIEFFTSPGLSARMAALLIYYDLVGNPHSPTQDFMKDLCEQEAVAWRSEDLSEVKEILGREFTKLGHAIDHAKAFAQWSLGIDDEAYRVAQDAKDIFTKDAKMVAHLYREAEGGTLHQSHLHCFADLHVYDSEGNHNGPLYNEQGEVTAVEINIPNSWCIGPETDPQFVAIFDPENTVYEIEVVGRGNAAPTHYVLSTTFYNETGFVLTSQNISNTIVEGRTHTFIAKICETGSILYEWADIKINPHTLNLKSNGQWITTYIELTEGHDIEDIDVSTVMINNTIPVDQDAPITIGDYDLDGVPDLMVKFDRASIIEWLGTIDYSENTGKSHLLKFTITGKALGIAFEGSDVVKALR